MDALLFDDPPPHPASENMAPASTNDLSMAIDVRIRRASPIKPLAQKPSAAASYFGNDRRANRPLQLAAIDVRLRDRRSSTYTLVEASRQHSPRGSRQPHRLPAQRSPM
jgi:hypothetical protein